MYKDDRKVVWCLGRSELQAAVKGRINRAIAGKSLLKRNDNSGARKENAVFLIGVQCLLPFGASTHKS